MKIGIITIHNSPNYGACLQSFALYKFLDMEGYDVEIINLYRPYFQNYVYSKKYKPYEHISKGFKRKIVDCLKKFVYRKQVLQKSEKASNSVSEQKFLRFNSQIKVSSPFYGIDALYQAPPKYDVYITGSDQVWNPTQNFCLEPYFLTFVKEKTARKISFASSIGIGELNSKEKKDFKRWLNTYDYISVREETAKKTLSEFLDKPIEIVADPTFLLGRDYWKKLSEKFRVQETAYILVFTLEIDKNIITYGQRLAEDSNKKLVILHPKISKTEVGKEVVAVNDAGPQEFLAYIRNADLVLTDSFHCTVFSIILGVHNFFTYIPPYNNRGSRITDLLKMFSLDNHVLNVNLNSEYTELVSMEIDMENVEKVFLQEQKKARQYLISAINGSK